MVARGATIRDIVRATGRTYDSISKQLTELGLTTDGGERKPWDDAESKAAAALDWPTFHARYPERTLTAYQQGRRHFRLQLAVPNLELVDYTRMVERIEGDAVIAACVHVPQTSPEMWARVLAVGERDAIPTLVIAGDVVTGDMFSHWDTKEKYEFDDELESLRLHLAAALAVFERLVITPGNHISNRIVKVTGGHVRLRHIIAAAGLSDAENERVATTDIDYVDLRSGGERFLVGHASNYSRIDGRVPWDYATTMESHVIVGNGHRMGYQTSKSGRWHAWEIGTLADPRYMGYVQRQLTGFPRMMQGFATVRGGAVRLYGAGLPLTDWGAEVA